MRAMSGKDFVDSMKPSKDAEGSKEMFVVGMAKPEPDNDNAILLGPTTGCGPWTKIPLEAITRVVPLMTAACKDHEHPIVAVYFNNTDDPTTLALYQLLQTTMKQLSGQLVTNFKGQVGTSARLSNRFVETDPDGGIFVGCAYVQVPIFTCWEKEWMTNPPPPAHPTPVYECGFFWITVPICF